MTAVAWLGWFHAVGIITVAEDELTVDIRDNIVVGDGCKARICTHRFVELVELLIAHGRFVVIVIIGCLEQRLGLGADDHEQKKTNETGVQ